MQLLNQNPQFHIRYTTNGNSPTAQSSLYAEPLVLDERLYSKSNIYTIQISPDSLAYVPDSVGHCIVIRAAVFDENNSCVSPVTTQSYFIRALGCDTHGLPAVSICADSLDLFGYENGIMVPGMMFDSLNPEQSGNYYMQGREWERKVNLEFREVADNSGINQACGLRTHGNRARRQSQKGLKIYAREEYGKKRFKHSFFEDTPMNSFKHLLLKPYSTLYPFTGIQDYICNQMALALGLESAHSRPTCLFINGEYWGIYFLQEKMDERYLEDHFGINIEQCNIVSNWMELECGSAQGFMEMMDWLETVDLSNQEDYDHLSSLVDIDNFIDYIIFETFVANADWPANNSRCWHVNGGKWRWMFFDGDAAFNNYGIDPYGNPTTLDVFGNATYSGNEYTWPSSRRATLMFRRLLENNGFRMRFNDRIFELCEANFRYENTSGWYNHITDLLRPEIEAQHFRFNNPPSEGFWAYACTLTDDFLRERVESYIMEWESFTVGIPEIRFTFQCYPNPSSGEIHLRVDAEAFGYDEIAIYDLLGRKVFAQSCLVSDGSNQITLNPNLQAGVYLLKMGSHTEKIIRY